MHTGNCETKVIALSVLCVRRHVISGREKARASARKKAAIGMSSAAAQVEWRELSEDNLHLLKTLNSVIFPLKYHVSVCACV